MEPIGDIPPAEVIHHDAMLDEYKPAACPNRRASGKPGAVRSWSAFADSLEDDPTYAFPRP